MSVASKLAAKKRTTRLSRKQSTKPSPGRKQVWVCHLTKHRVELGLSLRDVAEGVGLSIAGLFEVERGTDPMLSTADRLAAFYGTTVPALWPMRVKQ